MTRIRYEEPIAATSSYCPTFSAKMRDFHDLCGEVTDGRYTDSLNDFVLECQRDCLPVRLYIVIPSGVDGSGFREVMKNARLRGFGLLQVEPSGACEVVHQALALSLTGVRRIVVSRFPPRFRQSLSEAEEAFLSGDPVKACAKVYDELEAISRRLAISLDRKGLWRPSCSSLKAIDFNTAAWKNVLKRVLDCADFEAIGRATVNDILITRVVAITPHRNDAGHKPRDRKEQIRRDRALRTRFEAAVDLFSDFVDATRSLRL